MIKCQTIDHPASAIRSRQSEAVRYAEGPVVFVVGEDNHVREGLRRLLEADGRTLEAFDTCVAFLAAYRPGREGCLLVGANLPGMAGHELVQHLHHERYPLPAIMITGHGDVQMTVKAMKAGAWDVIEKPFDGGVLLASVERALEQSRDTTKLFVRRWEASALVGKLTPRQRQILELVLAGQRSKNIAADLRLSRRTVEKHRASIMKRMCAKSIPVLARLALAADGALTADQMFV